HPAGGQVEARRGPGLAGGATAVGAHRRGELGAGGAIDGGVDATTRHEGGVGGGDDGVDGERRDVALVRVDLHLPIVAGSGIPPLALDHVIGDNDIVVTTRVRVGATGLGASGPTPPPPVANEQGGQATMHEYDPEDRGWQDDA